MEIIKPHKKESRPVLNSDIERVYRESEEMYKLFSQPLGRYHIFFAMAHPQVERKDPLRFFILNPMYHGFSEWPSIVVINPEIIRHTQVSVDSEEGCMSFADQPMKVVQRFHKCEVKFRPLEFDGQNKPIMGKERIEALQGMPSKIFQHEIGHLNGFTIYPI